MKTPLRRFLGSNQKSDFSDSNLEVSLNIADMFYISMILILNGNCVSNWLRFTVLEVTNHIASYVYGNSESKTPNV